MRSYQDEEFQYVLFYQDQLTKFIKLRPLKTRLPQETAIQLVSIFSDIGAPLILGFDDGQEFAKLVSVTQFHELAKSVGIFKLSQ